MKSFRRPFLGLFFVAAAIMAVSPAPAKTLNWAGCGVTKKAFMHSLAKAFEEKTGTKIKIHGGGATKGIRGTASGEVDLGGSCRPALANDQRENVRMVQVAWDALVAIAHPSNPVDNITRKQLRKIFHGDITNWKALGGPSKFIIVGYRSLELSGVGYSFRELGFRQTTGSGDFTHGLARKSSAPLETAVENLPGAIAVTGVSSARKRDVKLLKMEGKAPSPENITSGDYPLYRPLYLAVPRDPSPTVKRFMEFALSAEGQQVIADQGTVNLEMGSDLDNPWGGDYIKPSE